MGDTVKGKDISLGIKKEKSSMSLLITQSRGILATISCRGGALALLADKLLPKWGDAPLHTQLPAQIGANSVS